MNRDKDSQTREVSQSTELHELTDLEVEWVSGGAVDVFIPLPPVKGE
jgi:hypothetical protein